MSFSKWLFKGVGKVLRKRNLNLVASLSYYNKKSRLKDSVILDYIRSATLELVAEEIQEKQLEGSVAEVGVFKGEFASRLNQVFPSKKLYLFDTFDGFDKRDKTTEDKFGFSTATQNFSNTSTDLVLSKMINPVVCIIKRGYFPATSEGIEDDFVFVSLDADLYEPIIAGLNFFYPKLVKGGYIFIHDYNNTEYKGANKAVKEFCRINNVSFVPIPDLCGTAIITK
jgi:O-methyltransferase